MKQSLKWFTITSLAALFGLGTAAFGQNGGTLTYVNILKLRNNAARGDLAPIVRIVSPLADARVAPGESRIGAGSPNGTGFALNVEVVTRDGTPITAREATLAPPVFGIRHVPELQQGLQNPDVPGLFVFFDCDLITPDGTVLRKGNNFASAFNVAGSDDTPGPGTTLWLGWHVLESIPANVREFTITVAFVDQARRIGLDQVHLVVDKSRGTSGQAITPEPGTFPGGSLADGIDDPNAPEVSLIAPRVPTSIAVGTQGAGLNATNGSLMFLHVTALDRSGAGIAVNENGVGRPGSTFPAGIILDNTQIPSAANGFRAGPNRNYPGLVVTFDVPLRQANGNIIPPGTNLAPLFDIVGSELDALTGVVRITADWVVGAALQMPAGKASVTISARVTDNMGRTGTTKSILSISPAVSGQDLTPNP
jgi:hypothetical protein